MAASVTMVRISMIPVLYSLKRLRSRMRPASGRRAKSATSAHRPPRYFRSILADRIMHWPRDCSAASAAARSSVAGSAPGPAPPVHILQAMSSPVPACRSPSEGCRRERSKDQPAGIDAAFFGLRTQIASDLRVCLEQPQYAAGDRAKQTHPDIEEYRRDLVTVVETAEHQPFGRQSNIPSRRAGIRHLPPSVVHLIAAGKMNQPFRKERLLARWDDEGVDDDIVDEVRAHGGGISEITHLHRRRAIGRYRRPGVMGIALQINQDIDPFCTDKLRGLMVRARANVDKAIERGSQPRPHRAMIVGAVGIGENLEAVTIVAFEQFGHQLRGGVLIKISGQIAKTNALSPGASLMVKQGGSRRADRGGPMPGTDQLIGGRRRR